jgi:hypothetical protein
MTYFVPTVQTYRHVCFVAGIHYGINAAESAANVFDCIDKIFLENCSRKNKDKVIFV